MMCSFLRPLEYICYIYYLSVVTVVDVVVDHTDLNCCLFHTKIYYAVYCVEQRVLHYFYLFLSYETREERALAGGQVQTGILGN